MSARLISAEAAWTRLRSGNERYSSGKTELPAEYSTRRKETLDRQRPFSGVLSCSDSRVPTEIVFDQGVGDLFVVRNAGQVSSSCAVESLEFAVAELKVPLIVVLSHTGCGAIKAAVEQTKKPKGTPSKNLAQTINSILPAITAAENKQNVHDESTTKLEAVTDEHLRGTVNSLVSSSELISAAVAAGKLEIVGAKYFLNNGRVLPVTMSADLEQKK